MGQLVCIKSFKEATEEKSVDEVKSVDMAALKAKQALERKAHNDRVKREYKLFKKGK